MALLTTRSQRASDVSSKARVEVFRLVAWAPHRQNRVREVCERVTVHVSPSVKVSLLASHYRFYVKERRADTQTLIIGKILTLASYHAAHRANTHQILTTVGHIRRSAVPPAHRRARLGAHDSRPTGAGGLHPPQRAHERPDGHRPHRSHRRAQQRDRRDRSPRPLLHAVDEARRRALLLEVEEEPCAHGRAPPSPHAPQVHLGSRSGMGIRRAMGAAASSASGWAGPTRKKAHICAPIVAEMHRLLQLRLGGDVGKKSELQLDDRSSATEARHDQLHALSRARGHLSATKWACEVSIAGRRAPRVRRRLLWHTPCDGALEPADVDR